MKKNANRTIPKEQDMNIINARILMVDTIDRFADILIWTTVPRYDGVQGSIDHIRIKDKDYDFLEANYGLSMTCEC